MIGAFFAEIIIYNIIINNKLNMEQLMTNSNREIDLSIHYQYSLSFAGMKSSAERWGTS